MVVYLVETGFVRCNYMQDYYGDKKFQPTVARLFISGGGHQESKKVRERSTS